MFSNLFFRIRRIMATYYATICSPLQVSPTLWAQSLTEFTLFSNGVKALVPCADVLIP
jgi:hypothetical protein